MRGVIVTLVMIRASMHCCLQARVAELEQQLHDSGKKFTKELGSIIEMHEAKVGEADAAHQQNVSLLKAELLEAKQLHSVQLEKACEEYSKRPLPYSILCDLFCGNYSHSACTEEIAKSLLSCSPPLLI